jgi:hypothetical protein
VHRLTLFLLLHGKYCGIGSAIPCNVLAWARGVRLPGAIRTCRVGGALVFQQLLQLLNRS